MAPLPFRLPLRALPLAIRVATKVRKAAFALYEAACALESDLESMAEPETVADLISTPEEARAYRRAVARWLDAQRAKRQRPRVCVDCGTSDDAGMCDSCAVLGTGRLPS